MLVKLRFNVIKNMKVPSASVHYEEGVSHKEIHESLGYYASTGIVLDLIETAKSAVRNIIVHLTSHIKAQPNYGRRPTVLCSVAADLKMNEVVDQPNWTFSCYMPLKVFRAEAPPHSKRRR